MDVRDRRARAMVADNRFLQLHLHFQSWKAPRDQAGGWRRTTLTWYSHKWQLDEQHACKGLAGYKDWERSEDQGNEPVAVQEQASASTDDGGSS